MKKMLYAVLAVFGLIALLLWMLGLLGGAKTAPGRVGLAEINLPAAIRTAKVEQRLLQDMLAWPGTVKARSEAQIAPKIAARIIDIKVHAGDNVKKGSVVVLLEPEESKSRQQQAAALLAAAQAEAERAGADASRVRNLYSKEAATRENLEQTLALARAAQARVQAAASAVQEAGIHHGETVLRAPFDGVVVARLQEPGDMGLAGVPVLTIRQATALRFEAAVPTQCATHMQIGDSVGIRIETLPSSLTAQIDEIIPEADAQTRTILIKANLAPMSGLQPGLFGWLEQACGEHQALVVPAQAVRRIGQLEVVTVVADGQQLTRHVRSGKSQGILLEIQSGLSAGETVLLP